MLPGLSSLSRKVSSPAPSVPGHVCAVAEIAIELSGKRCFQNLSNRRSGGWFPSRLKAGNNSSWSLTQTRLCHAHRRTTGRVLEPCIGVSDVNPIRDISGYRGRRPRRDGKEALINCKQRVAGCRLMETVTTP
jgi:hypothetical protein